MEELINTPIASEEDAVVQVQDGLPYSCFVALSQYSPVVAGLIAPRSTLRIRRRSGSKFSTAESERLVRVARVIAVAEEAFGDNAMAKQLLCAPSMLGSDPRRRIATLELAKTDSGARMIEDRLHRVMHGHL